MRRFLLIGVVSHIFHSTSNLEANLRKLYNVIYVTLTETAQLYDHANFNYS